MQCPKRIRDKARRQNLSSPYLDGQFWKADTKDGQPVKLAKAKGELTTKRQFAYA